MVQNLWFFFLEDSCEKIGRTCQELFLENSCTSTNLDLCSPKFVLLQEFSRDFWPRSQIVSVNSQMFPSIYKNHKSIGRKINFSLNTPRAGWNEAKQWNSFAHTKRAFVAENPQQLAIYKLPKEGLLRPANSTNWVLKLIDKYWWDSDYILTTVFFYWVAHLRLQNRHGFLWWMYVFVAIFSHIL